LEDALPKSGAFTGAKEFMGIRALKRSDREKLQAVLTATGAFLPEEIGVAMELIDLVLTNPDQRDYTIQCLVDQLDQPIGYVCYGPAPMTERTFDLYWIAVAPGAQGLGAGSKLMAFVEDRLRSLKGRMILADTSSIAAYEKTHRFYEKNGFREVARVPDYYSRGNDRITYCKRLE
jgi:ribosomal protein S18 acetylase RimI-like enzyme